MKSHICWICSIISMMARSFVQACNFGSLSIWVRHPGTRAVLLEPFWFCLPLPSSYAFHSPMIFCNNNNNIPSTYNNVILIFVAYRTFYLLNLLKLSITTAESTISQTWTNKRLNATKAKTPLCSSTLAKISFTQLRNTALGQSCQVWKTWPKNKDASQNKGIP